MISVTIDSPSLDVAPQWDDLVRRASSNVFMNPAALQAVHDTGFAKIVMLLAWEQGAEPRKLVGVWGLQLRKAAPLLPAVLEALPLLLCFPLQSRGRSRVCRRSDPGVFRGDRTQRGAAERRQPETIRRRISKPRLDAEGVFAARHRTADALRNGAAFRDARVRRQAIRIDAQEVAPGLEQAVLARHRRCREQPRCLQTSSRRSKPSWRWRKQAGRASRAPRCCPTPTTPPSSGACCTIWRRGAMPRWRCCGSTAPSSRRRC